MRILGGCVLALLTVGCSGEDPRTVEMDGLTSYVQRDSAGVAVSLTPGHEARENIGWEVESVPEMVLGGGRPPDGFLYQIRGIKGLNGGRVAVMAGGSQELRIYDSDGLLVNRVGRRGKGPEEFMEPVLVPTLGFDSLLVFDKALRRLQVFSHSGGFVEVVHQAQPWPFGRREPAGGIGSRHVIRIEGEIEGGGGEAPLKPGVTRVAFECVWYDLDTGDEVVVETFPMRGLFFEGAWPLPFTGPPLVATHRDGAFVANGLDPEIREYDVDGQLRRIFLVAEQPRPVTSGLLKALAEARSRNDPRITPKARLDRWKAGWIPDTLPTFWSLIVDELGWLWAEVKGWDPKEPKEWMVFDREGRARGLAMTPPGLDIRWIGKDRILGVWKDEFGAEFVHQHFFRRRGAGLADSGP